MLDVFSKAKRSQVMSCIRGCGNKRTEIALIHVFRSQHISGWRRHQKVFGKPDFIFRKFRLAVFVDGCFWHVCPVHGHKPKSNAEFWEKKFAKNALRDDLVARKLRAKGWHVLRIWEHEFVRKNKPCLIQRIWRSLAKASAAAEMPPALSKTPRCNPVAPRERAIAPLQQRIK